MTTSELEGLIAEAEANRDKYYKACSYGDPFGAARSYATYWSKLARDYRALLNAESRATPDCESATEPTLGKR